MVEMDEDKIRIIVREQYGKIADSSRGSSCCSPSTNITKKTSNSCCGSSTSAPNTSPNSCCGDLDASQSYSSKIGYTEEELKSVPEGSDLGLGCGNPTALASIKEGEVVVDLGSGAGFDCFLAANKVGKSGKVIGVDMTTQMIDKARENKRNGNYENVEFRLGEIENLPIADYSADLIISNCVINLSPDKERVYHEAFRVLKPGGRIMISDIVLTGELPSIIRQSLEAYVGCVAGALKKDKYLQIIEDAGFQDIEIIGEADFPISYAFSDETRKELIEKGNLTSEQIDEIKNFDCKGISLKVRAFKPQ